MRWTVEKSIARLATGSADIIILTWAKGEYS
jgi:hypothetical protein